MIKRVVGVDLSKTSTGISVIEVDNKILKVVDNYSIKPVKSTEFTKLHYYIKDVLLYKIQNEFNIQCGGFSVAFEFPVFSDFTSELQYYLTQEFLKLCDTYKINVVGYSPMFLKKFIKLFVMDGRKYHPILDKPDIRDIYERYVYPLNMELLPKPGDITDNDSMDALFLGLLGSVLQVPYLGMSEALNSLTMDMILDHKLDFLLLTNCNYYKDKYLGGVRDTEFDNFKFNGSGISFGSQFKTLIKDSIANNHLTLFSKTFFPFAIMDLLTHLMRGFRLREPDKFYEFWTKYLGSRKSYLLKKYPLDKNFECLINKRGHYFLYGGV